MVPGSLPIGRIAGFRGREGELTVRVASGEAARWAGLRAVIVSSVGSGSEAGAGTFDVESIRAYRDRLVMKLKGVNDPNAAEALRGRVVFAPATQVPALPEGVHYVERLVGLRVLEESGDALGVVRDVLATGGVDVLEIETEGGGELLVPLARSVVISISEDSGTIRVRLPEGLREGGVE